MSKQHQIFFVAVYVFLIKGDEILLLKRKNTGFEDGNYSVVAGHMDGNESVKEAAIREAKEEAGITITETDLEVTGVMHRCFDEERIDFFLATKKWQGEIKNQEPKKCAELKWFNVNNLPTNFIPYVRKAWENYQQNIWFEDLTEYNHMAENQD